MLIPCSESGSLLEVHIHQSATQHAYSSIVSSQVVLSVPSVCIKTLGLGSANGQLENRNFQIRASRQRPQQPSADSAAADTAQDVPSGNDKTAAEQLYWVSVASGGAHVGLGMTDAVPAVTASINSLTTELSLTRPQTLSMPAGMPSESAHLHASLTLHDPSTHCCCETLWPLIATIQRQQIVLLQSVSPDTETATAALAPSGSAVAQETWSASTWNSTDQGNDWGRLQGNMQADMHERSDHPLSSQSNTIQPHASGHADETQTAQQPADSQQQPGESQQQPEESQQQPAEAEQTAMVLQCVLQTQTAGTVIVDVMLTDGVTQAALSVDAMSGSVTVQPGDTAGDAQHMSVQAALKVCPSRSFCMRRVIVFLLFHTVCLTCCKECWMNLCTMGYNV